MPSEFLYMIISQENFFSSCLFLHFPSSNFPYLLIQLLILKGKDSQITL